MAPASMSGSPRTSVPWSGNMATLNTLVRFAEAIENKKQIELNTGFRIWEDFDYHSYVLRDIIKFINDNQVRTKPPKCEFKEPGNHFCD